MRTLSAVVLATLAGAIPAVAQPYHRGVSLGGNERSEDVQVLGTGGYVSVGSRYSPSTFTRDMIVSRHAADGTTLWARSFSGGGDERATSVAEAFNGDIVVAGVIDTGTAAMDLGIVRLSPTGAIVWARQYPHTTQNGCYDCLDNPTIKRVSVPQHLSAERGAVGVPVPEFAITHQTTISPPGDPAYSTGALLIIDANGDVITHERSASPNASLGEHVSFNDLVFDPGTSSVGIVGSYAYFTPLEQMASDTLFVRYDLLTMSQSLSVRYDLVDPFNPSYPGDELGRGVDVLPQIATVEKETHRFLIASEYFGFSTFNAGLTLAVMGNGAITWARTQHDFVPAAGAAKWDYSYNAVVAGFYMFGDGGRLARMISYDYGSTDRFMRTYDPTYNTGFSGLAIANPNFNPSQYLAGGDHAVPFVFDSNVLHTHTDTMGAVGCADALEFLDPDLPDVTVTPAPLVVTPMVGSQPWTPTVAVLTAADETLCTPIPNCPSDLDDGTGSGTPDGGTDINDLLYFLGCFELGGSCADVDDDGSDPQNPDGGTDINDLLFFLMHFEIGC